MHGTNIKNKLGAVVLALPMVYCFTHCCHDPSHQLTFDDYNDWFPHISPDGKWIAFISFPKEIDPGKHPFYKHCLLRIMPYEGGTPKIMAYIYGGQGTINVPSWSPDSKKIAFVTNSKI